MIRKNFVKKETNEAARLIQLWWRLNKIQRNEKKNSHEISSVLGSTYQNYHNNETQIPIDNGNLENIDEQINNNISLVSLNQKKNKFNKVELAVKFYATIATLSKIRR